MKQPDFLKDAALKNYIRASGLRSSRDADKTLNAGFNRLIATVILEAGRIARRARKKNIQPKHVEQALQKHVGAADLTWDRIVEQILAESPADLGEISKAIKRHIAEQSKP